MKDLPVSNCTKCRENYKQDCVDESGTCMCKNCPRNIEKCIITRWCSETESPLDL
jgi:hypothetical protein